jgi:iron(III) transport system ATP-binding protein
MKKASKAASVEFVGVTKRFGSVVAVGDINFVIEPGALVTFLGPSGCGKTTTLRLIAGLEMATEGTILIGGTDVTRLAATDRDVSMVFQSYALFPHMTVIENVSYGLKVGGLAKAEALAQAEDGLALVGLEGFGARLPSELSGGQQQRVAVARALVLEPQVLLFDEPLSNLDAKLRRRVREEIRDLQRKLELTSVYVTHDQEEALAVSDKIIVMNNAVIAQEGSPHDLYEQPVDTFVADFIGDSNLVQGEIASVNGETAQVMVGGIELTLPSRGLPPGAVDIAIRPEACILSDGAEAKGSEGSVRKAVYLGTHIEYTIDWPLGELFVIDHRVGNPFPPGSSIRIWLADHGVTVVKPNSSKTSQTNGATAP